MDRLIAYKGKYRETLSTIPDEQREAKAFRKMSAKILRAAPKPERFLNLVKAGAEDGLDPKTKKFTPKWYDAENNDKVAMQLLQRSAEAMDDMIALGYIRDEWDTPTEICRSFQRGRCRRGAKCPYRHVASANPKPTGRGETAAKPMASAQKSPPGEQSTEANQTNVDNPDNRCEADLAGKRCKFGAQCWRAHPQRPPEPSDSQTSRA